LLKGVFFSLKNGIFYSSEILSIYGRFISLGYRYLIEIYTKNYTFNDDCMAENATGKSVFFTMCLPEEVCKTPGLLNINVLQNTA